MNLQAYLNNSKKSLFRFEALQYYDVGVDDMSDSEMIPWWNFIKNKTSKENVVMQRVRLIKYPLTKYTKKELEVHKKSIKYGDDIRIINSDEFNDVKDFWLVDDDMCLEMLYDDGGKWLGFKISNEVQKYIKIKDILLAESTPLA